MKISVTHGDAREYYAAELRGGDVVIVSESGHGGLPLGHAALIHLDRCISLQNGEYNFIDSKCQKFLRLYPGEKIEITG
jgi:hypothetical protein